MIRTAAGPESASRFAKQLDGRDEGLQILAALSCPCSSRLAMPKDLESSSGVSWVGGICVAAVVCAWGPMSMQPTCSQVHWQRLIQVLSCRGEGAAMSLEDSQKLVEQSGQAASAVPSHEARQQADRPITAGGLVRNIPLGTDRDGTRFWQLHGWAAATQGNEPLPFKQEIENNQQDSQSQPFLSDDICASEKMLEVICLTFVLRLFLRQCCWVGQQHTNFWQFLLIYLLPGPMIIRSSSSSSNE